MKLGACIALLACAVQDKPAPIDYCTTLAPRKPIAGLAGFQSTSTLVYDAAPDRPHVFETTYVFPGRARWDLSVRNEPATPRRLEYRCGSAFFVLADGSSESEVLDEHGRFDQQDWELAGNAEQKCRAMELRRALFLWPDGFEWRGEGDLRTAQSDCGTKLDARLGEGGRPTSVSASLTDPDAWIATYRDITWRELRGRWWPASMRLELVGHAVWTETVDSIETAIHLLDEFFVPPDRRVTGVAPNVVRADLPAALELRVALPVDCDWAAARERASQLEAGELAKLVAAGWRADVGQWFALDERGRPSACVLRLRPTAGAAPSGWALSRESTAVCAAVSSLETELAAVLGRVRSTIPPGALAATPMVRVVTAGAQTRVQLVLPLRPAR